MALVTCPECKNQVSETAANCPRCGYTPSASQQGYAQPIHQQQPQYNQPPNQEVHKGARAAMWFSLSSLFLGITAPVGLILASRAQKDMRAEPQRYKNGGQASVAVLTGAIGMVILFIAISKMGGDDTTQATRSPTSQQARSKAAPTYVSESCFELATKFGAQSKRSDLQKDNLWPSYKGKHFKWNLQVTEVSSDMFGGYTVQFKCSPKSNSFVQDIQLKYPSSAKVRVSAFVKGATYEVSGVLKRTSTLLGFTGDSQ